mgnify:CR=1 FL=1
MRRTNGSRAAYFSSESSAVPVRTADGRDIRRAFVPEPGDLMLSADYSQIELRLMADMSGRAAYFSSESSAVDHAPALVRFALASICISSKRIRPTCIGEDTLKGRPAILKASFSTYDADYSAADRKRAPLDPVAAIGETASVVLALRRPLEAEMEQKGQRGLFDTVETPMVAVLAGMEWEGARIDVAELKRLSGELAVRLSKLENEAFSPLAPEQKHVALYVRADYRYFFGRKQRLERFKECCTLRARRRQMPISLPRKSLSRSVLPTLLPR